MSLALSIIVASLISLVGIPYRTYAAWWSWNAYRAIVGVSAYFLVAGGGAGAAGWLAGRFSGSFSGQELWLRGLLFGLGGAAALRASFRVNQEQKSSRVAQNGGRSKGVSAVEQTVSALAVCVAWVTNMLNDGAEGAALKWFGTLSYDDLRHQSRHVKAHILASTKSDSMKGRLQTDFAAVVKKTRSADADERADAHAQLAAMCASYAIAEQMPKTRFAITPP